MTARPIAVNGRFQHSRVTGVQRYAREVSARLAGARIVVPPRRYSQVPGHLWEQLVLPLELRSDEVLWSPANSGPWQPRRHVVTLHDASVFDHPEWFRSSFAAWTRFSWKRLARRAAAIVTDSGFSRDRLVHHLRISDQRIHVIELGVSNRFAPQPPEVIARVKARHGIGTPYVIAVGSIEPRKNLATLALAWERLRNGDHTLVIAGAEGSVFASGTHGPSSANNVLQIGYVPDDELPALYSGAAAAVVPSLYEGFGLTAIEAMACGTPVIVSNATCFPATVGDAAVQVNPIDARAMAAAMADVISNGALAGELRAKGLERARQFSWDTCAAKLAAVLATAD